MTVRIGDVFLKIDSDRALIDGEVRLMARAPMLGAWLRTARRDQPSETVIGPSSR